MSMGGRLYRARFGIGARVVSLYEGSVAANWQSGVGSSGEAGADLISIGSSSMIFRVLSLLVDITKIQDMIPTIVTLKLFQEKFGVEEKIWEQDFEKGTDPDRLQIITEIADTWISLLTLHRPLRVELYCDNPIDNGKSVDYEYILEEL